VALECEISVSFGGAQIVNPFPATLHVKVLAIVAIRED